MPTSPLHRPVWSALTTGWSSLSQGDGQARRIDPAYGPFAAAADNSPTAQAALAALIPADGELWIVEAGPVTAPSGVTVLREAMLAQMVAEEIAGGTDLESCSLNEADAEDMRALAALTRPGPFLSKTHRYGGFIGVRERGVSSLPWPGRACACPAMPRSAASAPIPIIAAAAWPAG